MADKPHDPDAPMYDRALLLHGAKRNEVLTLHEVRQYGIDSFADPDYLHIYGMSPDAWYARGVRLLGRTAVECTRDALGDLIGKDVAAIAAQLPSAKPFSVIDPFAGSCNTLFWILKHIPGSRGVGFELDQRVFELSKRNVARLDQTIELEHGDYRALLAKHELPPERGIVVFVAPPWGTALDEAVGLDLRRTAPPITDIIDHIGRTYRHHKILFATQVYEKVNPASLVELQKILDWSELRVYDLNDEGRNHGILLGTKGWKP